MKLNKRQMYTITKVINDALEKLYREDAYLIANEVHERSIVCRFLIYLQHEVENTNFKSFQLDADYNKDHSEPKRTKNRPKGTCPDVILHKRGSNEGNIFVIEFKTGWSRNKNKAVPKDIHKLQDFTEQSEKYKYGVGFFIMLEKDYPHIQTFIDGQLTTAPSQGYLYE